jgi:hypothetical protein
MLLMVLCCDNCKLMHCPVHLLLLLILLVMLLLLLLLLLVLLLLPLLADVVAPQSHILCLF